MHKPHIHMYALALNDMVHTKFSSICTVIFVTIYRTFCLIFSLFRFVFAHFTFFDGLVVHIYVFLSLRLSFMI